MITKKSERNRRYNERHPDRVKRWLETYRSSQNGKLRILWMAMRSRCDNPSNPNYCWYGARGVAVCWADFQEFKKWALANGWKPGLQIGRRNNDGSYGAENCRFVASQINNQNRRSNKLTLAGAVEIKRLLQEGVFSKAQIADKFGVSRPTISGIVHGRSWKNA